MFEFNSDNGLISPACFINSPNQDPRPIHESINLIVVHCISLPKGQFGGDEVAKLFQNKLDIHADDSFSNLAGLKVSAHLFIRRDGKLVQFVPLQHRAWHAGKSNFAGREACNDFSIGIELEGCEDIPYTDIQYHTLAQLCVLLQRYYPQITAERIVGHCDIAPERKTDPGSVFDWPYLRRLIKAYM